jgi:hypothetical protein
MRRAAVLVALLTGCSASNNSPSTAQTCVPPLCAIAPMQLAAEVTPSVNDTNVGRLELASLTFGDDGTAIITLPPPVILTGRVTVGTGSKPQFLSGTVVATRPSRIPGRPDESYQTTLDVGNGTYMLPVTEPIDGETYTLRVLSNDNSLYPPQIFSNVDASIPPGSTSRQVGFDLVLDDPTLLTEVDGIITDPVGKAIAGLQVQALDPSSRSAVSTTSTTDSSGGYSIRLSKSVSGLSMLILSVVPTQTAPAGTPSLESALDLTKVGPTNRTSQNLSAPALPAPAALTYHVNGVGSSGATTPVVGAQVTFLASVTDPTAPAGVTAVFEASGQTDGDGSVTLALIPAAQGTRDYLVTIAPPATSDFAAVLPGHEQKISVGATSGYGGDITLALRPMLSGRVIDSLGAPVRSLTVQPAPATVTLSDPGSAGGYANVTQVGSTTTAPDGRFAVRLDPGGYDVALLPIASMRLPRRWLQGVTLQADQDLGDLRMPTAAMVNVVVEDDAGLGLNTAQVQLYLLPAGPPPGCIQGSCLLLPRIIAEGTSDVSGRVPLLLPAATSANTNGL